LDFTDLQLPEQREPLRVRPWWRKILPFLLALSSVLLFDGVLEEALRGLAGGLLLGLILWAIRHL